MNKLNIFLYENNFYDPIIQAHYKLRDGPCGPWAVKFTQHALNNYINSFLHVCAWI